MRPGATLKQQDVHEVEKGAIAVTKATQIAQQGIRSRLAYIFALDPWASHRRSHVKSVRFTAEIQLARAKNKRKKERDRGDPMGTRRL